MEQIKKNNEISLKDSAEQLQQTFPIYSSDINTAVMKMAEVRTGLNFAQETKSIFDDLKYRFPKMTQPEFTEIMKKGCLLEYGKIYRLTVSTICEWAEQYYINKNGIIIKPEPKQVFIVKR